MKNKNTIIKIILIFITLGIFLYANATDVNVAIKWIINEWDNTLKVDFDKPMPDTWLSGEMKVFKDLWIISISKDTLSANKIKISLDKEIKVWSTYNIFSVFWVDWSADFIVEDSLNAKIVSPAPEWQWIIKIVFSDKKNLDVEFKNPLSWTEFEFKLLEDLSVSEISSASWSMILKTSSPIENNTDYILIMIALTDKINNNYILNESIYDFNIWNDNLNKTESTKEEDTLNVILNSAGNEPVKTEVTTWTWIDLQTTIITKNWDLVSSNIANWSWSLWNLEVVAIKSKTTPDTGPETTILILLTLIINSIYFLTRKFSH